MQPKRQLVSNPYKEWFNTNFLTKIRILWKNSWLGRKFRDNYDVILPSEDEKAAVILSAALTPKKRAELIGKYGSMTRIDFLDDQESSVFQSLGSVPTDEKEPIPMRWFDHSVMNSTTGKIVSMDRFAEFCSEIHSRMQQPGIIDFHCMAGVSRSSTGMRAYFYLHPERLPIKQLPQPTFQEITNFLFGKRKIKSIEGLKGGQKGLLGLVALYKVTGGLKKEIKGKVEKIIPENPSSFTEENRFAIAQDVGLMLDLPLDRGFRDEQDIEDQKKRFKQLYDDYSAGAGYHHILVDMLPSGGTFSDKLTSLSSGQLARFAILAEYLRKSEHKKNDFKAWLTGIAGKNEYMQEPLGWAKQAVAKGEKGFTAGDKVELLRTFGRECGLDYKDVAKSLVEKKTLFWMETKKSRVNRHNAGIQLAELFDLVRREYGELKDRISDESVQKELAQLKEDESYIKEIANKLLLKGEISEEERAVLTRVQKEPCIADLESKGLSYDRAVGKFLDPQKVRGARVKSFLEAQNYRGLAEYLTDLISWYNVWKSLKSNNPKEFLLTGEEIVSKVQEIVSNHSGQITLEQKATLLLNFGEQCGLKMSKVLEAFRSSYGEDLQSGNIPLEYTRAQVKELYNELLKKASGEVANVPIAIIGEDVRDQVTYDRVHSETSLRV